MECSRRGWGVYESVLEENGFGLNGLLREEVWGGKGVGLWGKHNREMIEGG